MNSANNYLFVGAKVNKRVIKCIKVYFGENLKFILL